MGLATFALVGTAISTWLNIDPRTIRPLVTVLLILTGSSVAAIEIGSLSTIVALLVVCGLSEIVGVFTGLPFGRYEYTDQWWPTVRLADRHFYPLLLPFAWLMIVGGAYRVARTRFNAWQAVPICAAITVLIDMPMERAMTWTFAYWRWIEGGPIFGAPIANSIGWFVVSIVAASLIASKDSRPRTGTNSMVVLGTFCLFAALTGFIHLFHWAWVMLAVLGALLLFVGRNHSAQQS